MRHIQWHNAATQRSNTTQQHNAATQRGNTTQQHNAATQRLIATCARGAKRRERHGVRVRGVWRTGNNVFELPRLLYVTPFHSFHCRVLCEACQVRFSTSPYQSLGHSADIPRDTSRYLRISARADTTAHCIARCITPLCLACPLPALASACPCVRLSSASPALSAYRPHPHSHSHIFPINQCGSMNGSSTWAHF